ncbi:MAG: SIMPL domain-containing protein [Candidatus Peribacteria bacterium]|jgi:uncharacterized protein YggE|nr:SIMPL domain-containing protein [Candidatus Peribacteria bacterium]
MTTTDRLLGFLAIIIVCSTLIYTFKPDHNLDGSTGISVSGKGIAKVQPDTLTLNFSIQEKADSTKEAQKKIDEISSKFITLIGELGVGKKQIQTSNYSVYQNYYRDSQTSKQIPDGYNASQNITVILNGKDFVELGQKVLSAAPTVGNININGSTFSVTDKATGEKDARTLALENAKAKAQQLADVAGVKLGKAVQISESISAGGYYPVYANAKVLSNDTSEEAYNSVGLEAGENEVIVNVSVSYEIK